jgi:hypothetical protein
MAELTEAPVTVHAPETADACCGEAAQATCCQIDEKVDCCGGVTSIADGCGCGAA